MLRVLVDSKAAGRVEIEECVAFGRDGIGVKLALSPAVEVFILDLENRTWSLAAVIRIERFEALCDGIDFRRRERTDRSLEA